jgi:predicted CXXCH cytochrome family protein
MTNRLLLFLFVLAAIVPLTAQPSLPLLPVQGRPGGYVGSDNCKSCHTDEYNSWHRTYHRTMTQYARPDAVKADFNNVKLEFRGEEFLLQKTNNEFWVTISDKSASTAEPPARMPIGMLTGFHHMQVFWLRIGAGNAQLGFPFTWLIEDKRWVPREATFLRDPTLQPPKEIWNTTCVRCHSTAPQPRPDKVAEVYRTRVAEMGIACEACHGPGEKHIAFQKKLEDEKPKTRPPDPNITQPKKLSHDRASQICAQCHSMKYFDQKSNWLEEGFAYHPGEDLEAATPVMRPRKIEEQPFLKRAVEANPALLDDFFWSDGMMRVSGREYNGLIESPCYQRGNISCLSCHSMHDSDPNDQLKAGMDSNKACLQCHEKMAANITAHTRHKADSSGSECYNCHMPNTTYGLLKAMRSHEINNPTVTESLKAGRPNACNLCHLDKSLAWTGEQLKKLFNVDSPTVPKDQSELPATVLWALKGDAGQRALAAWHLGWQPAQQTSGTNWPATVLAPLLTDSYAAVRYIAARSLRTLPGFADLKYDYVAEPPARAKAAGEAGEAAKKAPQQTLFDPKIIPTLLREQNQRPLHLRE